MSIFNIDKEGHPQKQLPLNLAGNIAYFLVNLIIGLLLVPYFISTLGVAAYGIIPLATSLNSYIGLLTSSVNTAVSRPLTIELKKGNIDSASKTYNTAFFGFSTILVLLVLPGLIIFSLFAPVVFNVPPGLGSDVIILFLGVNGAFLIRSWANNYTVSLFAYNRLDLINLVNVVNVVVQVFLILLFFSIWTPSLSSIGIAYLIGGVSATVIAISLSRRINPSLNVNIHDFDCSRMMSLMSLTGWVVFIQMGDLLFNQTDLVVVNILFGAMAAGEYAIAFQWVILLRVILGVFASILTPIVLHYFAQDNLDLVIRILISSVKIMGLIMALFIGLICGCAPQLLTLWVGSQFAFLAPLIILLTFHWAYNSSTFPLQSLYIILNKLKIPGIVTLLLGVLDVILAITLSSFTGWGYYGVAAAAVVSLTLKNTFFYPLYSAKIAQKPWHTFFKPIIPGLAGLVGVAVASYILINAISGPVLFTLAVTGITISIVYAIIIIRFVLNRFERDILASYLPEKVKKYIV
jgi:O-antigen/teichoic acid export membrane protein